MLAVSVYPSVGNFCTDTCVSERCVRPPKGSSTVDRRIEHLDQPLLREDIVVRQVRKHLFAQRTALHLAAERIAFLDRTDRGLGIVLGPCAVDELARKIDH